MEEKDVEFLFDLRCRVAAVLFCDDVVRLVRLEDVVFPDEAVFTVTAGARSHGVAQWNAVCLHAGLRNTRPRKFRNNPISK